MYLDNEGAYREGVERLSVLQWLSLSEQGNLVAMMTVDFFQLYKHIQYSMGAIYLTVLNLPHGIRSKQV